MNLFRKTLFCAALFFSCVYVGAQEPLAAFPGAEGFGRFTVGGRGGKVYHVTTLEDDKDGNIVGSFRYACKRSEARTIVFDVSGTIELKAELKLNKGNVTIAGQTAPGDGICIAGYPFVIAANQVIIRYMRFRLGNKNVADHEGDGLGGMDKANIVVDHCSVSWSIDECLSVYGSKNITVQWCIASQSLNKSGHSKGEHGYGGNWGGSGASYHHNLLCHHKNRVPRLGPRPSTQLDERMDMRNNVFYNWAGDGCYGGEAMNVNIVNNYYKPGPATESQSSDVQKRIAKIGVRTTDYCKRVEKDGMVQGNDWLPTWHVWGKLFVDGNYNSKYPDMDEWNDGVLRQIDNSKCDNTFNSSIAEEMHLLLPIDFQTTTTHSAEMAFERVLEYAGASLRRDWVDDLMVSDTRDGVATNRGLAQLAGLINSQEDNRPADASEDWSAWPVLQQLEPQPDSDSDGMPDEWEDLNGLDKDDVADGSFEAENGYTNLENYLNGIVAHITKSQNAGGEQLSQHTDETSLRKAMMGLNNRNDNIIYNLGGLKVSKPLRNTLYVRNGLLYISK